MLKNVSDSDFRQLSFSSKVPLTLTSDVDKSLLLISSGDEPLFKISQAGEIFLLQSAVMNSDCISGLTVGNLTPGFTLSPSHGLTLVFEYAEDDSPVEVHVSRINIVA